MQTRVTELNKYKKKLKLQCCYFFYLYLLRHEFKRERNEKRMDFYSTNIYFLSYCFLVDTL